MDRNTVENVLFKIGVPVNTNGFKFITDAVMIIDERPIKGITKDLYPEIAKKNRTIPSRVERTIRHAFATARSPKGNYDAVEHYIGFINCENGNSLKMLHMRIKQECENNAEQMGITETEDLEEAKIRRIVREELKAIMGGI